MNTIKRVMSKSSKLGSRSVMPAPPTASNSTKSSKIDAQKEDFEVGTTLGTGTFGRVTIARYVHAKEDEEKYYAMKTLKKSEIIRLKQVTHIKSEVLLLAQIDHPFIVNMVAHFQDTVRVYMVLEYVPGGELFSYLRNKKRLDERTVVLYSAQVILAFWYLHSKDIIYRDLKPENLLIDETGYLKIADFGFAKVCPDRTFTLCGTPEYLAPEIIQSKGHGRGVDWWALGVLIYEMVAGYPPFYDNNPFGIYQKILAGKPEYNKYFTKTCTSLVAGFLSNDLTKRLGLLKGGIKDITSHAYYKDLSWEKVVRKEVTAPYKPTIRSDGDTSNFDNYPESNGSAPIRLSPKDAKLFDDFGIAT